MAKLVFHLFIAGRTARNEQLATLFREACAEALPGRAFTVEVTDLLQDPQPGEQYKILALPSVLRTAPGPERRIIGNLNPGSAREAVAFLTEDLFTL